MGATRSYSPILVMVLAATTTAAAVWYYHEQKKSKSKDDPADDVGDVPVLDVSAKSSEEESAYITNSRGLLLSSSETAADEPKATPPVIAMNDSFENVEKPEEGEEKPANKPFWDGLFKKQEKLASETPSDAKAESKGIEEPPEEPGDKDAPSSPRKSFLGFQLPVSPPAKKSTEDEKSDESDVAEKEDSNDTTSKDNQDSSTPKKNFFGFLAPPKADEKDANPTSESKAEEAGKAAPEENKSARRNIFGFEIKEQGKKDEDRGTEEKTEEPPKKGPPEQRPNFFQNLLKPKDSPAKPAKESTAVEIESQGEADGDKMEAETKPQRPGFLNFLNQNKDKKDMESKPTAEEASSKKKEEAKITEAEKPKPKRQSFLDHFLNPGINEKKDGKLAEISERTQETGVLSDASSDEKAAVESK